jgi:hypothetical protein
MRIFEISLEAEPRAVRAKFDAELEQLRVAQSKRMEALRKSNQAELKKQERSKAQLSTLRYRLDGELKNWRRDCERTFDDEDGEAGEVNTQFLRMNILRSQENLRTLFVHLSRPHVRG